MPRYNYEKLLVFVLYMISVHSFFVGLGLIFIPNSFLELLGYAECSERFYRSQGGVFHIAMAINYVLAASNIKKNEPLIWLTVIIKLIATLFLFTYTIFEKELIVVIFSGISDLAMGGLVYFLYQKYKGEVNKKVIL